MHSQDHQVGQNSARLFGLRCRGLTVSVIDDHGRNLDIVAQGVVQVSCKDVGIDHCFAAVECQDEDVQRWRRHFTRNVRRGSRGQADVLTLSLSGTEYEAQYGRCQRTRKAFLARPG